MVHRLVEPPLTNKVVTYLAMLKVELTALTLEICLKILLLLGTRKPIVLGHWLKLMEAVLNT